MAEPPSEKSRSFNVLKSILNAVDAFICVTVPETGEILYLNDRLVKNFGLENDGTGQYCYKLLRNLAERCGECPYHQLEKEPDKPVVWEQYEPLVNRTFRKIGMYIDWPGGETAHLEYGFDITDILQTQSELERRIAMADALNKTLEIFCAHKEKTFDEVMTTGLRPVADIMDLDRIIVYRHTEMDGQRWPEQIYRWDKGNRQLGEKSFGILREFEVFAGWVEALGENRCVNQRVEDMSAAQAAFVSQYGIKSILMVPIFLYGQLWGSVNFQDHTRGRKFEAQAVELMRAVANTCASAIIRAQAEREAASANEAARFKSEEASRAKSEFMSRVSHEMLTPMNAIMGMAQLIKIQYQDQELNKYAEIIENASQDLLKMIRNILDMSSLEFGALKLEMTDFSLRDIFAAVREGLERHLAKKRQIFKADLDPSIPERLFGDEKQLAQVLTHLLKNAIKFTPDNGEVAFKAQVQSHEKEDIILLFEISDNGIGMTREQQEKLFEVFEQADGTLTRQHDGLGLGLAYSKRIIGLMGGQIGVESELGRGTKFTFNCRFKSR